MCGIDENILSDTRLVSRHKYHKCTRLEVASLVAHQLVQLVYHKRVCSHEHHSHTHAYIQEEVEADKYMDYLGRKLLCIATHIPTYFRCHCNYYLLQYQAN